MSFSETAHVNRAETASGDFLLNFTAPSGGPTLCPTVELERQLLLALPTTKTQDKKNLQRLRIGIHLHAFHLRECDQILKALSNSFPACELLITTNTMAKQAAIQSLLDNLANQPWRERCEIQVVANRGRNIAPLLREGMQFLQHCNVALHLHTKRSDQHQFGSQWLTDLLNTLVGDAQRVEAIITAFATQPKLGLAMPQPSQTIRTYMNWGGDFDIASVLVKALWPKWKLSIMAPLLFPAGMMFWFQPKALLPMVGALTLLDPLPMEPLLDDGTPLHALERLTAHACEVAGLKWALISNDTQDPGIQDWSREISVWEPRPEAYLDGVTVLADSLRKTKALLNEKDMALHSLMTHRNELEFSAKELAQALEKTTTIVSKLEADVSQLRLELDHNQQVLRETTNWLQQSQAELRQRDLDIAARDQALLQASALQQKLQADLNQCDLDIAARDQALLQASALQQKLQADLNQRDLDIAARDQALLEISALQQKLQADLNQCDLDIAARDQALLQASAIQEGLYGDLQKYKLQLGELHQSLSWRLSKPIRYLANRMEWKHSRMLYSQEEVQHRGNQEEST